MSNNEIILDDSQMDYTDIKVLTNEEVAESNEEDVNGSADIIYYTTEFDLMSLIQRINDEEIIVPSFIKNKKISNEQSDKEGLKNFQRGFVWTLKQKQNLIDSILKGYPTPGIFLVFQKDETFLVLDGQQRLTTIMQFREGEFSVDTSSIQDVGFTVEDKYAAYKYSDLDKVLRRKFNNYRVGATVISDILPKSSGENLDTSPNVEDFIYSIFGRLNSGGTQLTPHEIRIAVYSGKLADEINNLNVNEKWRALYKGELQKRSRDHELISRIIAMYLRRDDYRGGQKEYLNKFYRIYRNLDSAEVQRAIKKFEQAIDIIHPLGPSLFRTPGTSNVNAAWTEALVASIMVVLDSLETYNSEKIQIAVRETQEDLMSKNKYEINGELKTIYDFITSNTASKTSYLGRFELCYSRLQENLK
ncbi:GmrSD restriction endonuclease domain-containing protein [Rothia mucilaginosa]|uniref:GmrSD restriction endonucleases N-terminal domain-containing protein n=1 Tax=Rothia mucilaginosa TaxID=43675 RepID=A0A0K2S1B9_9MICC|nr:DUF262 domain-containing protein [Rothia mucilaginosa]BAS20883.1 hypothetical protein RM6536_1636 [Rothia mucilaginosa]